MHTLLQKSVVRVQNYYLIAFYFPRSFTFINLFSGNFFVHLGQIVHRSLFREQSPKIALCLHTVTQFQRYLSSSFPGDSTLRQEGHLASKAAAYLEAKRA